MRRRRAFLETPTATAPGRRLTAPRLSDFVTVGEFHSLPEAMAAAAERHHAEFVEWHEAWIYAHQVDEGSDDSAIVYDFATARRLARPDPVVDWMRGMQIGNAPAIVVDIEL